MRTRLWLWSLLLVLPSGCLLGSQTAPCDSSADCDGPDECIDGFCAPQLTDRDAGTVGDGDGHPSDGGDEPTSDAGEVEDAGGDGGFVGDGGDLDGGELGDGDGDGDGDIGGDGDGDIGGDGDGDIGGDGDGDVGGDGDGDIRGDGDGDSCEPGEGCREGVGICGRDEICDDDGRCPDDTHQPVSTLCRPSLDEVCDPAEYCQANGTCAPDLVMDTGTECRPAATGASATCNPAEYCQPDGTCAPDVHASTQTLCRAAGGGAANAICNPAEYCQSNGTCAPNTHASLSTPCRAGGAGDDAACDPTEYCQANGTCAPNLHSDTNIVCRSANGPCDVPDTCRANGTCGDDEVADDGEVCRAALPYLTCDLPETCDGVNKTCPENTGYASSVTVTSAANHHGFVQLKDDGGFHVAGNRVETQCYETPGGSIQESHGLVSFDAPGLPGNAVLTSAAVNYCVWSQQNQSPTVTLHPHTFTVPINSSAWTDNHASAVATLTNTAGVRSTSIPTSAVNLSGRTQFELVQLSHCGTGPPFKRYGAGQSAIPTFAPEDHAPCPATRPWELDLDYCVPE